MTYLTKKLAFFSNLDGMQALCAEKVFAKNSPSQALPRQIPLFVTFGDIFPRSGGSLSSKGEPSH